jgi:release factor glutamine methyltransferase
VRLAQGSWFGALDTDFGSLRGALDVIVSNPPYIADHEVLPADVVDFEPGAALFAGPDGTEALAIVLEGAAVWLRPGGVVVVELAPHQAEAVAALATSLGLADVEIGCDLTGRARFVVGRRPLPDAANAR